MIKLKSLLVAAILISSISHAQTVDEIVDKYTDAIGGKEKIGQLKTIYTETSLEVMGNASPAVEYLAEGKGFKSESLFNGMEIVNVYTDKSGWTKNPLGGINDPQSMPAEAYNAGKYQIYFGGALVNYAAKGNTVELIGKDGNNYNLKVTSGGVVMNYFIDATTYLLNKTVLKNEFMGQQIEVITSFSDYKKTEYGIVLPYSRATDFGGFAITSKVTKIEVNKEFAAAIFDMPK